MKPNHKLVITNGKHFDMTLCLFHSISIQEFTINDLLNSSLVNKIKRQTPHHFLISKLEKRDNMNLHFFSRDEYTIHVKTPNSSLVDNQGRSSPFLDGKNLP